ncbi:MAG: Asp23/Gls24 family envelope stress response protein [Peptoniphilus sp.]|uniref:Asp23/Gls24 family envelope stress response protein n=1 Tax=Peptoniphilus sp. TaxID=1971214 RepID=UPI002A75EFC1|nr:Asp23/Gls24 family envelope stress response protein [Peptoniphilus sp.]MDY2987184.1 Asp23/Gls24 family envelope stress response protein [Peptoniphilus sp.]
MSEKYLVNTDISGDVKISEDVIATISVLAAESVDGVAKMQASLKSSVTDILGVKNVGRGVKVSVGEQEAVIDTYITVEYGRNIVGIAKVVQEKVKEAVENMTGLEVVEINVHVSGIAVSEKEKVRS